jgi:WD40 repeat protein
VRNQRLVSIVAASLLWAATATSALGHHNHVGFDTARLVELRGTVTKMDWVNPHAWITISVKRTDGTLQAWKIQTVAPGLLTRRGMTKDSITAGAEIKIEGYAAKDGSPNMDGYRLTYSDGRTVSLWGTFAPDGTFILFGSVPNNATRDK